MVSRSSDSTAESAAVVSGGVGGGEGGREGRGVECADTALQKVLGGVRDVCRRRGGVVCRVRGVGWCGVGDPEGQMGGGWAEELDDEACPKKPKPSRDVIQLQ